METQNEAIELEGIFINGYGTIPKFIMHDYDLSLESKAIYAYFCALSGSGKQTNPYRDNIVKGFKIAKNTYYVHYKPLIDQGYVRVVRPLDRTKASTYIIVENPKKLKEFIREEKPDAGLLKYNDLNSLGYGLIPKQVMLDERLTIKTKGLYAYFCSYCGIGDCCFPLKTDILYHLNISEPTYYKCLSQLKEFGYMVVVHRKRRGRFTANDYYLGQGDGMGSLSAPPEVKEPRRRNRYDIPQYNYFNNNETRNFSSSGETKPKNLSYAGKTKPKKLGYASKTKPKNLSYEGKTEPKNLNYTCKTEPNNLRYDGVPEAKNQEENLSSNGKKNCYCGNCYDRISGLENNDAYLVTVLSSNSLSIISQSISEKDKKNLMRLTDKINIEKHILFKTAITEICKIENLKNISLNAKKAIGWICNCLDGEDGENIMDKELDEFIIKFENASRGIKIKNPLAYFKASLWNWFAEQPLRDHILKPRESNASYDLAEIEHMINTSSIY